MSDGGMLSWKRQTIDESRGPAACYKSVSKPLPKLPKNMKWAYDETTKEWTVVDDVNQMPQIVMGHAIPMDKNASAELCFVQHEVEPSDTFAGICLRYKVTPTDLRRANGFSGSNLLLAPNPLNIPVTGGATSIPRAEPVCTGPSKDQLVTNMMKEAPGISRSEAKAYLDINEWNYAVALKEARSDA